MKLFKDSGIHQFTIVDVRRLLLLVISVERIYLNFIYNFVIEDYGIFMSGKDSREKRRLKEREKCDYDWKPMGTMEELTHLKLVCSKCGETTLIELFS